MPVRSYPITFVLGGLDADLAPRQLATLLECLVWTHALYLRTRRDLPDVASLLRSGALRYDPYPRGFRPEGAETWVDAPTAMRNGRADDRTLAAWRCAEYRLRGIDAKPVVRARLAPDGKRIETRPVVRLPDGRLESPLGDRGWRPVGAPNTPDRHRVEFVLELFGPGQRVLTHATLQCMLDALTDIDARYLRAHPETPLIHASGVRYQEEPPGQEDWQDVPTTLRLRVGDCDDLSPWRAAELRVRGYDSRAIFKDQRRPDGGSLYHIQTVLPGGAIEDPSRDLGMR